MNTAVNFYQDLSVTDISSHLQSIQTTDLHSIMNKYSVYVQTIDGISEFQIMHDATITDISKDKLLKMVDFTGEVEEVINVMVAESREVTIDKQFVINVITDHPEKNTYRFNIKSSENLTSLSQAQLLNLIDLSKVSGEVFHICCIQALEIN